MEPSGSSRYEVVRTFKIVGLLQIYVLDYVPRYVLYILR